jgi:hypothetical protein
MTTPPRADSAPAPWTFLVYPTNGRREWVRAHSSRAVLGGVEDDPRLEAVGETFEPVLVFWLSISITFVSVTAAEASRFLWFLILPALLRIMSQGGWLTSPCVTSGL